MDAAEAARLHADALVMDMTCPLMNAPAYWHWWAEGGVTVAAPSVGGSAGIYETIQQLGRWLDHLRRAPERLCHVTTAADVERAKREGRLGILFHFQGTLPFERNLDMLEVYHRLGVRVIQLAYNERNHVCSGCEERSDDGLSNFGIRAVRAMNRLGIVIDCAHTGLRSTYDAMTFSERPVVVSHGNARAVCDNARNLPDDLIRALAAQGGLMGLNGFPAFVRRDVPHPSVDDLVDHCVHICQLTGGADHVAVGIDYYAGMAGVAADGPEARAAYEARVAAGVWDPRNYPPPPHRYPAGIDDPSRLAGLTLALARRGFGEGDIRKILGLNWIRVMRAHGM